MNIGKLIEAARAIEQAVLTQEARSAKLKEYAQLARKQSGLTPEQRYEYEQFRRVPQANDYGDLIRDLISALNEKERS